TEAHGMHECMGQGINPFWGICRISRYWECPTTINNEFWEAPKDLFWICGDIAYARAPGNCARSCTIGVIKLSFFLLPKESRSLLESQ
ncbi:ENR1 protein, partial [Chaetops frenatus]|nr:ENR1 protein [Chaetops frenatus]